MTAVISFVLLSLAWPVLWTRHVNQHSPWYFRTGLIISWNPVHFHKESADFSSKCHRNHCNFLKTSTLPQRIAGFFVEVCSWYSSKLISGGHRRRNKRSPSTTDQTLRSARTQGPSSRLTVARQVPFQSTFLTSFYRTYVTAEFLKKKFFKNFFGP